MCDMDWQQLTVRYSKCWHPTFTFHYTDDDLKQEGKRNIRISYAEFGGSLARCFRIG